MGWTDGVAIRPTPVVGGVGLIEDVSKIATLKGAQPGDSIILIGDIENAHLGASLYAREWLGLKGESLGPPPPVPTMPTEFQPDQVFGQWSAGRKMMQKLRILRH